MVQSLLHWNLLSEDLDLSIRSVYSKLITCVIIAEQEARQIVLHYLAMCVRFGMQSIHDSTVPAHLAFHAFNMQPHGSSSCMMEESSADRNQRLARLRAQRHRAQQLRDSPRRSQTLASQRECEARRHEQESSERRYASLPHNSCSNCLHMAIPLTRPNRLAAMRESDERITSIFHTLPASPLRFMYALVRQIPFPGSTVYLTEAWRVHCRLSL